MASLKVVLICSLLLTSLLAPALARIYIVDDGLPDGASASGSDSKSGVGDSSNGLQLNRRARDAAAGWTEAGTATPTTHQRSRGHKKYKDTLAEADIRAQEAFEALRTVEKRIRQGVDPTTDEPQNNRPERYRRRKPQEPPPPPPLQQFEQRPSATSSNGETIGQQYPTGDAYSATGSSAAGPSSEGADYDDGAVNQQTAELMRVAPQQQPPTASNTDPLYPSRAYSSDTNQLAADLPTAPANNVQYQNLALSVATSSPYNANLAYSTIVKDSASDYSESSQNSLQFMPSDSRINPYVKTVDPASSPGVSSQLHASHSTDGRSEHLENQISSSYDTNQPVSDNPSSTSHPVKADDVLAYIGKKYEDHLPTASQDHAYSFQVFNNGQTVVHHSGQSSSQDLQPSPSSVVYRHVAGTGQILPADQSDEPHVRQQLRTVGGNNAATLQSSSKLNSHPHFDDGRPSEDRHRLVHTGPVLKFTLDDRIAPPTGYNSREQSKETNPTDARPHSGGDVPNRKGKSREFDRLAFGKQENGAKTQEAGLTKMQVANVDSTISVSTEMNKSQSSDRQSGFRPSIAVDTADAFQGNLPESNIGGLVETSAPALGSKSQRDVEGLLSNQVSSSRTVTGSLKFAPSAPDQTAMASTSGGETANFLSVSNDHRVTQKRTTAPAMGNDPFTLTVGAKLQTESDHQGPITGENREARFSFPQSTTNDHQRMVFPDKVSHDSSSVGYKNFAGTSSSHQMLIHGHHSQGFRHHQPLNTYVQRLRPLRQPGSDIVYGSPPRPGASRVQRPWGLVRPVRGAPHPHPHPHRQRRPLRISRPLRLHKLPTPPAAGNGATAGDSVPSSSSVGNPVALPAPSYGSGSSPPHVSFVEAGPWGQFKWSVSHDVALKPTLHWR